MKKNIIINRKQLSEITSLDEDVFNGYLSHESEPPADSLRTHVDGRMADDSISASKPITGDEFTDMLSRSNIVPGLARNRFSPIVSMAESKINEENQDLKGIQITVEIPETGESFSGDEDELSSRMTRAKKQGDKATYKAIKKALDSRRTPIKKSKEIKKNILGWDNVYQKKGGKKNSGNGKAHTKKKTGPTITYFE